MTKSSTVGRGFVLLAALVLTSQHAAAQAPVQSFTDLQPLIKPGQQVIIQGDDGQRTEGQVVSLSGNQLEIARPRFFRRSERRVFSEGTVARIQNRDSDWEGGLLGLGIGFFTALLVGNQCSEDDDLCDFVTFTATPGGVLIGMAIDGWINRSLYVSPRSGVVTVAPVIGRQRAWIAAAIRF